jgi:S1-C subfamily serine protease
MERALRMLLQSLYCGPKRRRGQWFARNRPDGTAVSAQNCACRCPGEFLRLVVQLQPAVVNISKQKVQVATSLNPFTGERRPVTQEQASGGSGFLISSDGYIVTNNHVVAGGPTGDAVDRVTVTLFDGKEYTAEIVGRDPQSDIALLKIKRRPAVRCNGRPTRTASATGLSPLAAAEPQQLGHSRYHFRVAA